MTKYEYKEFTYSLIDDGDHIEWLKKLPKDCLLSKLKGKDNMIDMEKQIQETDKMLTKGDAYTTNLYYKVEQILKNQKVIMEYLMIGKDDWI